MKDGQDYIQTGIKSDRLASGRQILIDKDTDLQRGDRHNKDKIKKRLFKSLKIKTLILKST